MYCHLKELRRKCLFDNCFKIQTIIVSLSFFFLFFLNTSNPYILTAQPDEGELVAKLVSLFSSTVLSVLFGLKTFNVQFKYLSYSKWIVLVLYIFSWSFTVMGMLLVTTNNGNQVRLYHSFCLHSVC